MTHRHPICGKHVPPPIPSLASAEVQRYSDGQLKWIIKNGISPWNACCPRDLR
jgi:hypothetical protein